MGNVKQTVEGNLLMPFQGQLCGNAVDVVMQVQIQNAELQATGKKEENDGVKMPCTELYCR